MLALLFYWLAPVLTPFVVGALLAYLSNPLIERLERLKLTRTLAVALVFLILSLIVTLALLIIIPMLSDQVASFISKVPGYVERFEFQLSGLAAQAGLDLGTLNFKELAKEYLPRAGSIGSQVFKAISQSGGAIISGVVMMLLIPIITFYMLRDWDEVLQNIYDLIPLSVRDTVLRLTKRSDEMLAAFIRGQLMVMTALGIIYSTGLMVIDLPFALLIGIAAGLLSFIPYLGTIVGVGLAVAVYLAETQSWAGLWQVGLVFVIGQSLEGYVLTPWLVGDKIGLHPIVVIFAVLAGGQLFGFVGILLALPVSAVLAVLAREALKNYKQSDLYLEGSDTE